MTSEQDAKPRVWESKQEFIEALRRSPALNSILLWAHYLTKVDDIQGYVRYLPNLREAFKDHAESMKLPHVRALSNMTKPRTSTDAS